MAAPGIRSGAGLLVIVAGVCLLVARRHPRFLARIKPTQLALWSFAVATAHGAGLMLLPIYLGLCTAGEQDAGHQAAKPRSCAGTSGRRSSSRLFTLPR